MHTSWRSQCCHNPCSSARMCFLQTFPNTQDQQIKWFKNVSRGRDLGGGGWILKGAALNTWREIRTKAIATGLGGRKAAMGSQGKRLFDIVWPHGVVENKNRWNLKTACMHLEPDPWRESTCAMLEGYKKMTQGILVCEYGRQEVRDPRRKTDKPQPCSQHSREEFFSLWVPPSMFDRTENDTT